MDKATIGTFTANTLFYVPFGAVLARRRKLRSACDDFFVKRKNRLSPAPLLLLSKSNPLRWASIWFCPSDGQWPSVFS